MGRIEIQRQFSTEILWVEEIGKNVVKEKTDGL